MPDMATPAPAPEIMTTAEVAELLRVSDTTVSRWANDGLLPALKVGDRGSKGTIRFRRSDVEAFLTSSTMNNEAAS